MIGGVGVYLLIGSSHYFCIKMGCRQSTNTRSELLALQTLLAFAKELGLPSLHVFGDSTAIINWATQKEALTDLNLEGWCHNIVLLKSFFHHLELQHVYREFNVKADGLYKEALIMGSDLLHFTEFTDDECIGYGTIQFY